MLPSPEARVKLPPLLVSNDLAITNHTMSQIPWCPQSRGTLVTLRCPHTGDALDHAMFLVINPAAPSLLLDPPQSIEEILQHV